MEIIKNTITISALVMTLISGVASATPNPNPSYRLDTADMENQRIFLIQEVTDMSGTYLQAKGENSPTTAAHRNAIKDLVMRIKELNDQIEDKE